MLLESGEDVDQKDQVLVFPGLCKSYACGFLHSFLKASFEYTVDSLLKDFSIRRTPPKNGHLELVPAFLHSLYLTLYKTSISLRRTLTAGPKGVRLRGS